MVTRSRSTVHALLVAAPAALGLWMALLYVHTFLVHGPITAGRTVPYLLMGGVLFGTPVIAVVLVFVALPGWLILRRTIGVTLGRALFAGAVCGVLARVAGERLWGEPEASFLPLPVVLLAGMGTAWVWWRTWVGPEPAPPGRGTV